MSGDMTICAVQTLLLIILSTLVLSSGHWSVSEVSAVSGHYPTVFCKLTNALLDPKERIFRYKLDPGSSSSFDSLCGAASAMWSVLPSNESMQCSETYDEGFVFTMYFYYGSNYFHLHYDMMIPLFSLLRSNSAEMRRMLMPAVESARLQAMYWDTTAFQDNTKYWYQMLEVLSTSNTLQPLDGSLKSGRGNICFNVLHFGTPRFSSSDKELIIPYIRFIKSQLNIGHKIISGQKIGIIKRTTRRRILNEDELIQAISGFADVELVEFSGLTFKQQIQKVQSYAVLVGMNGAGLMNGLFLSHGAVAVQLVPYKADLNFVEFKKLLQARGPYLEWHNEHADLSKDAPHDPYHGQSDTIVTVSEFVKLVKSAISLVNSDQSSTKSEL